MDGRLADAAATWAGGSINFVHRTSLERVKGEEEALARASLAAAARPSDTRVAERGGDAAAARARLRAKRKSAARAG